MILQKKGEHHNIYHVGSDGDGFASIAVLVQYVADATRKNLRGLSSNVRREGSPSDRFPNIAKLKALGYAPKVDLGEGLRRTVAWFRENQS